MSDFAKIVRASDGEQVLFYKSADDEGRPTLVQASDYDGITLRMEVGFKKGEFDKRDAAFSCAALAHADSTRYMLRSFIEEDAAIDAAMKGKA